MDSFCRIIHYYGEEVKRSKKEGTQTDINPVYCSYLDKIGRGSKMLTVLNIARHLTGVILK